MKHTRKHLARAIIVLLVGIVVGSSLSVRPVLAHDRIEVGPYVIVIGWEKEPVIVGERNALFFAISEDEQPVADLDLDVTVSYAGETFRGNLVPSIEPGQYTVEILPTVRGQYQVLLSGALGDTQITEVMEPEEVLPARVLQFPEVAPDALELQATIADLSNQLQTAQMLTIGALLIALVAIGLAIVSLVRSRR